MPRSERKQALRTTVLAAAEKIIAEHGLGALKARDVAQAAGCSLGAIYTVFSDLDDLVLAVNARTLERLEAQLSTGGIPTGDDPESNIGWLVALSVRYLKFAAGNRLLWLALFEHRMRGGREVPAEQRHKQLALFTLIEHPLERLSIEPDPDRRALLARSLFSAVHGIIVLGLEEKLARMSLETIERQLGIVVTAVIAGLLAIRAR